ncbi:MAG: endolytic transglycosylase MltG [Oscillospiraceae bacterium]|nr:endolytic transglycosylase MltG [Oscillospiraceae bacterium]
MKKVLVLLLAAVLFLAASGCSVRNDSGAAPEPASARMEPEQEPSIVQSETQAQAENPRGNSLTLTINEGDTLSKVATELEKLGVCSVSQFIDAAQNGDFGEFPLVAAQVPNPNRCFVLEGYLFPGVYEIYPGDTPDGIIRRILSNTERQITGDVRKAIEDSGYTADEIITIASLIEKESMRNPVYMREVSSVLHNRLHLGMQLQLCETIDYVEDSIKPFITGDINRYNEYYNAYKCPALPAGAICNPGLDAIRAAVDPAQTDYLFYLWDKDNNYHFEATYDKHSANVAQYLD